MSYKAYFAIEKQLHAEGVTGTRAELIDKFTRGKKQHLTDLNEREYEKFLGWMESKAGFAKNKNLRMRRKIIALFHNMGYQVKGKIDMDHLNYWCRRYGHLHKDLNCYTGNDLVQLVTQAEKYYESYIEAL